MGEQVPVDKITSLHTQQRADSMFNEFDLEQLAQVNELINTRYLPDLPAGQSGATEPQLPTPLQPAA